MNTEPSARWISTTDAAARLGVHPRAVQKRAARGSIAARKIGNQWEIDVDSMDASTGPKVDVMDASNGRIADATDASDVQGVDAMDASTGLNGRVHMDASGGVADGERVADLRDEVKFLRGVIEQLQRDGAETRAALRSALKLTGAASVPMLTAGDAPPVPQPTPTEPPQRNESGAAVNEGATGTDSPKDASAPGTATATGAALTYGDIADEIERNLNQ